MRNSAVRRAGRFVTGLLLALALLAGASQFLEARQQPPPKTPSVEGFVPVDQLPQQEQLPAAPLLMAAYAVAWLVILGYVWSLWSRIGRVERDIVEVNRRISAEPRR